MDQPLKATLDAKVMDVIVTLVVEQKLKPGHHKFELGFDLAEFANGYDIFNQYLLKSVSRILPTAAPWEGGEL